MIHILLRHCDFSQNSKNKLRPSWFSRKICYNNISKIVENHNNTKVHIIYDGNSPTLDYLNNHVFILSNCGSDANSYIRCLQYLMESNFKQDDIIYFLEDDYLHQPDALLVLEEGIKINNSGYVTLYDHPDKYTEMYSNYNTQYLSSNNYNWRTTPSTTNTFACLYKTIMEDIETHLLYTNNGITIDHEKFLKLDTMGRSLISSIPGYSTHVENGMLSPNVDWQKISNSYL